MTDILIRDLPDEVVIEIDARAALIGLSRAEYIRRQLVSESRRTKRAVSADDLLASDARLESLLDDELMNDAWR